MKALKQAAVIMGWFLILDLAACMIFEAGILYGKTDWQFVGLVTVVICGLIFWMGRLYERHLKAIAPLLD